MDLARLSSPFIATEEEPDQADVTALAEHVTKGGVFYVSCWGAGCERVHDLFDAADVGLDVEAGRPPGEVVVMTTWHDSDPLADALEFFWMAAAPAEGKAWGPTYLALSVGSTKIHELLADAAGAL